VSILPQEANAVPVLFAFSGSPLIGFWI